MPSERLDDMSRLEYAVFIVALSFIVNQGFSLLIAMIEFYR